MIRTVSLETAKALKDAGFKQSTSFYYDYETNVLRHGFMSYTDDKGIMHWSISAPTTDELLEVLPSSILFGALHYDLAIRKTDFGEYVVKYAHQYGNLHFLDMKSLPEALAQMWFWLKKERLLLRKQGFQITEITRKKRGK